MLFGLPIASAPIGPIVVPVDWKDQVLQRFQDVLQPRDGEAE